MLVEVMDKERGPTLFEATEAYADRSIFASERKDRTVLDSLGKTYKVELPYREFVWAYARAAANGEPFLDLKPESLARIRADYRDRPDPEAANVVAYPGGPR